MEGSVHIVIQAALVERKACIQGAIIIRSLARVGTGLHCADLVSAHCPELTTGGLHLIVRTVHQLSNPSVLK